MNGSPPAPPGQEQAGPRGSLDLDRISARQLGWHLVACPGGAILRGAARGPRNGPGGQRSVITGLSPAAARRLREHLVALPLYRLPAAHVTLTFHDGYTASWEAWKGSWHHFSTRLLQKWAPWGPGLVWVLELQKRGAPHFHVIVTFQREPNWHLFQKWVQTAWNAIAEPGDAAHFVHGTHFKRIRAEDKQGLTRLSRYLAGYIAKAKQKRRVDRETGEILPTGRMWGVDGNVPQEILTELLLSYEEAVRFRRRLRSWGRQSRYLRLIGKRYQGALVMGDPGAILQVARGLGHPHSSTSPPAS